jgi:hypothetical protein
MIRKIGNAVDILPHTHRPYRPRTVNAEASCEGISERDTVNPCGIDRAVSKDALETGLPELATRT